MALRNRLHWWPSDRKWKCQCSNPIGRFGQRYPSSSSRCYYWTWLRAIKCLGLRSRWRYSWGRRSLEEWLPVAPGGREQQSQRDVFCREEAVQSRLQDASWNVAPLAFTCRTLWFRCQCGPFCHSVGPPHIPLVASLRPCSRRGWEEPLKWHLALTTHREETPAPSMKLLWRRCPLVVDLWTVPAAPSHWRYHFMFLQWGSCFSLQLIRPSHWRCSPDVCSWILLSATSGINTSSLDFVYLYTLVVSFQVKKKMLDKFSRTERGFWTTDMIRFIQQLPKKVLEESHDTSSGVMCNACFDEGWKSPRYAQTLGDFFFLWWPKATRLDSAENISTFFICRQIFRMILTNAVQAIFWIKACVLFLPKQIHSL